MPVVVESAPLCIAVELGDQQHSLSVAGKADHSNIHSVVRVLHKLASDHERCVALDLRELESTDEVAVERLACSVCILKEQHKRVNIRRANDDVLGMVDDLGLGELFCLRQGDCLNCKPCERTAALATWSGERFHFSSSEESSHHVRKRVDQVADRVGLCRNDRGDVMLAVGEAVTNAIRHGQNGGGDESFSISCVASPERLCVHVSDHGPGFNPEVLPSLEEVISLEHGRGIHCMRAVMDEVSFHFGGGTTTRMVKYATRSQDFLLSDSQCKTSRLSVPV